ncbi:MAG TPA: hypothetical protein PLC98_08800, partial [Anaerolineales bacterium]|nr:hypothetical protein [Anaerolineales bacterium]
SLINPRAQTGDLTEGSFEELAPLLTQAVSAEVEGEERHEQAVVAQGLAKAAELLAGQYSLVPTNVPYLGSSKQHESLKAYCETTYPKASADLATCFVSRVEGLLFRGGSIAVVVPQNWLFLRTYRSFRKTCFASLQWDIVARLGPGAFEMISGEVVNVALMAITKSIPLHNHQISATDSFAASTVADKSKHLREGGLVTLRQSRQHQDSDAIFQIGDDDEKTRLGAIGFVRGGITSGDAPQFRRFFWEVDLRDTRWALQQSTVDVTVEYGGRESVLLWDQGRGELAARTGGGGATIAGREAWSKRGVAITYMSDLKVTLYTGELFENVICVLIPRREEDLVALWAFASSEAFVKAVRSVNQKLSVDVGYFEKAPIDINQWREIGFQKYPNGVPDPSSTDITQWLFGGRPKGSSSPLQVAVARLVGYQWPRQMGKPSAKSDEATWNDLADFCDQDGIVCLPPINREQGGAARLRQLLATALGKYDERALLLSADPANASRSTTLEDWLRDAFFVQHTKQFFGRPFVWHLWDGRADGFHVLVNYHKLDHANLQKLTYSYLGDWIRQQEDDVKADVPGAVERLQAARGLQNKLAAILEGEAPLDIFVRWKALKDQAIGWNPDLNDGIRQNIRPFLMAGDVGRKGAGLFRSVPLKLNDKDRGTEPIRPKDEYPWFWCEDEPGTDPVGGKEYVGTRWNNVHLTLERKRQARSS